MQTKGRYDKLNLMTFSVWPWGSVLYTGGWNDRGWTYQESYFSQRRLIFTDEQVLFDCDRGVISEDLQHSQIPYLSALEKWQPNSNGDRIYNLIEKYSTRVLTHDQDILNAFDGILADFDQQEPPTRSHWGVPLVIDASGYLNGLLIGLYSYLDIPFENLDLSPDTYHSEEIRTCHAIYLFSADEMFDPYGDKFVYNIFSMLLVSKVGTNWERVGLWQPSFESEEEAQVFEQWLQSSPTYKTRDFWIA
ncbi:unnamed protein product [Alternaria alternata]